MKALLMGALLAAGLAAPAVADQTYYVVAPPSASGGTVVVSCFRGPWREVIWDRPNAVFLDSLRAVGYDYATAESIANRVCRDVSLVDDVSGLKAEMERIIADSPNFRGY